MRRFTWIVAAALLSAFVFAMPVIPASEVCHKPIVSNIPIPEKNLPLLLTDMTDMPTGPPVVIHLAPYDPAFFPPGTAPIPLGKDGYPLLPSAPPFHPCV